MVRLLPKHFADTTSHATAFQSHNGAIAAEEYRRLIYLITGESDVGEIIWGKQLAERAQQDLLGQG
jgi:hypothetical protein